MPPRKPIFPPSTRPPPVNVPVGWHERLNRVQALTRGALKALEHKPLGPGEIATVNKNVREALEAGASSDEAISRVVGNMLRVPPGTVTIAPPSGSRPMPPSSQARRPLPPRPAAPRLGPSVGERWDANYAGISFTGTVSEVLGSQVLITMDTGSQAYVPLPALTRPSSSEGPGDLVPF
jgi:hypothetical protein